MTAKTLTVAQHKGGAGKTTLSAQLAAAFDQSGAKVLLMDVDPQGSLSDWHAERVKTLGRKNNIMLVQTQGWKMTRDMARFQKEFDYIFIDTPPHAESESSIAIRAADLVLLPIQPSPLDIWACGPTIKIALQEKRGLMLVMNRVPPKSNLNGKIMEKLEAMNIEVARQTLGNRVSFASSIMQGLGVVESDPRSTAADEIRALVKEIKKSKVFKDLSSKAA